MQFRRRNKQFIKFHLKLQFFLFTIIFLPLYPASRGFFLLWLLVITKSFAWLDCHESTLRQTNHANDFINAESQVREKPLLAGYCLYKIFPIHP